ncbi:MAG TPA: NfeD family protein [Paludibacter sp.]|nr:NfeD family protein [Paludibacter sp.]
MEITIIIVLLLLGVVFLLLELFLVPGVSLAGIAATLFIGGAIVYAYSQLGPSAGNLTLLGSVFLVGATIWAFLRSKMLERFALKTNIEGKVEPLHEVEIKVGDKGVASSRLAPMGKVKVNGHVVEAKTNSEFIDQGVEIVVLQVMNTNVLVEKLEK